MEQDRTRKELDLAIASLAQLVPVLLRAYPIFASVLDELKENYRDKSGRIFDALPKLTETLAEIDQGTTERLADQIAEILPELERFLKPEPRDEQ